MGATVENREQRLGRDCRVTLIPAGDEIILPKGTGVIITQTLGGSITIRTDMGLFRLESEDVDALGDDFAEDFRHGLQSEESHDGNFSEDRVWNALKTCYDPEIPVNIVDLGLIYDLNILDLDDGKFRVEVMMTLTAQGCGMGPAIAADAKAKIEGIPKVNSADVRIVWDPQWTPHMISEKGRKVLGLD